MKVVYKQIINKIRYKLNRNLVSGRKLLSDYIDIAITCLFLRPVSIIFCGGFMGVLTGLNSDSYYGLVFIITIFSIAFSFIIIANFKRKVKRSRLLILLLAATFCLYCYSFIQLDVIRAKNFLERNTEGGEYDRPVEGNIVSLIDSDDSKEYSIYYLETDNHIMLSFYSSRKDLAYGTRVSISGRIREHRSQTNPGEFDAASFYRSKGIHLKLVTTDKKIEIFEGKRSRPNPYVQLLIVSRNLRDKIESSWNGLLSIEESAVLGGMLLGDKSEMSSSQLMWFRNSNLSHLIAVSGLHVSYFLIPVAAGARIIGRKRFARLSIIVIFLLLIGFLTGWSASVARAIMMVIGSVICSLLGKRYDSIGGLFLSGLILLIISPYNAADIGFQLSFSATFFILLFSGKLEKKFNSLCVPGIISGPLACMICAQIGMMPILLSLSGKQSFILMLVSIGGVFLSQGICLLAIPICLLRYCLFSLRITDMFFRIAFLPISGLLQLILQLSRFGSFESVGALRLQSLHPVLLTGLCAWIIILCLPKSYFRRLLSKLTTMVIALGICLNIILYINRPIATIIFTDVGQGDCTLVLCDHKSIIIDGGDVGEGINTLIPILNYYGIRKIDIAILTHPHSDHMSGLLELVNSGKITNIGTPDMKAILNQTDTDALFFANEIIYQLDAGDNIDVCDKVKLSVLSPNSDSIMYGEEYINENSLITLLTIGNTGILFMGDAGFQTENNLLRDNEDAKMILDNADFLKVGHHGSKYSTSSEFLAGMNLKAAVISVGPNFYGHPTDEAIQRLISGDIDVFRTDLNGAVILDIYEHRAQLKTMISSAR